MSLCNHPRARSMRGGRARITGLAAAALGVAAFAAPGQAFAAVNTPPVLPHTITSFPQRDFISADGFHPADSVIVEVLRNNVAVAHSTPITPQDDPKTDGFDGLVEVNHPGGGCWVDITPDIRPGDAIRTTVVGSGVQDQTTTANVTAEPATVEGGILTVHGTAQDGAGNPLPIDQIEQRIVANQQAFPLSGTRTLRADGTGGLDGTLAYDADGSIHWTARYPGANPTDIQMARANETRILWLGSDPASGAEGTIYETSADPAADGLTGGPSIPDCTPRFAPTAITGTDRTVVNAANVTTPLVVRGVSSPDITSVSVRVGAQAPQAATVANGSWTATIPAADLAALPQGAFTLTASYVSSTGAPEPDGVKTLTKDTVAPPAPTATPAAGTYPNTQVVTLSDAEQAARLFYTNDGAAPTTASLRFTAPLTITASQVINAIAVDDAGNASPMASLPFTIAPAVALPPVGTTAPGATTGPVGTTAPGATPGPLGTKPTLIADPLPKPPVLRLGSLTVPARIGAARLRQRGLRVAMTLPRGATVVRIRVYRASGAGRRVGAPLARVLRVAPAARALRVTLRSRALLRRLRPGRYIVEVSAGTSRTALGPATRRLVTIGR